MIIKSHLHIIVYYRRNLKMPEGKLAEQVAHCVANITLQALEAPQKVIVLKASDAKYVEYKKDAAYVQVDLGYTFFEGHTETCCGIIEWEQDAEKQD